MVVRALRLPLDEIARSKTSLMPESLAATLTFQELLDLTAFLKDGDAQKKMPRPKTASQ